MACLKVSFKNCLLILYNTLQMVGVNNLKVYINEKEIKLFC